MHWLPVIRNLCTHCIEWMSNTLKQPYDLDEWYNQTKRHLYEVVSSWFEEEKAIGRRGYTA